jgi:uncharacterized protein (TIGR00369 family)
MGERAPKFERYDEDVARGLIEAHDRAGGLPGWLGIRLVEMWPGGLRAQVEVRDELLTPFRNLHGGVLAALVDHVLGTVCYPVMPAGSWAATTEFKLNYLAPVTSGILTAVSEVISLTKRTAVVRIAVTASTGPGSPPDDAPGDRLVCTAQGTVLVMAPKPRS